MSVLDLVQFIASATFVVNGVVAVVVVTLVIRRWLEIRRGNGGYG